MSLTIKERGQSFEMVAEGSAPVGGLPLTLQLPGAGPFTMQLDVQVFEGDGLVRWTASPNDAYPILAPLFLTNVDTGEVSSTFVTGQYVAQVDSPVNCLEFSFPSAANYRIALLQRKLSGE